MQTQIEASARLAHKKARAEQDAQSRYLDEESELDRLLRAQSAEEREDGYRRDPSYDGAHALQQQSPIGAAGKRLVAAPAKAAAPLAGGVSSTRGALSPAAKKRCPGKTTAALQGTPGCRVVQSSSIRGALILFYNISASYVYYHVLAGVCVMPQLTFFFSSFFPFYSLFLNFTLPLCLYCCAGYTPGLRQVRVRGLRHEILSGEFSRLYLLQHDYNDGNRYAD